MNSHSLPDAFSTGAPEETAPPAPGRVSTGVQWLDVVLAGGIPENRVHLIVGKPGTGKTTLGLQFLLAGRAIGQSCLYVTLAETRGELERVAQSHEIDLTGIEILEVGAAGETTPEQDYTALHPGEIELSENVSRIIAEVERLKPQRILIDSLSEFRQIGRENMRYRRQMTALKNFLINAGATVYLLDTCSHLGGQLETICHGVIELERIAPEYGRERRRLQILKMREVAFHGGYHDYSIEKGGIVVWARLIASEHGRNYEMEPISSDVPELDQMLGGGPDRGTTMLTIGPAGAGKSSFCHQYCMAAMRRGEYFAWFSFDERLDTIFKRAKSMNADLRSLRDEGKCHLEQVDPGSISPGEFIQRVRRQVEKFNARIVVLDSLNGYLAAMPGEQFLVIQMHELLTYLAQMGVCTIIVIAQHGLLGSQTEPPIDLSYLADSVVHLRYFECQGGVRRALSVVKKRGSSHETAVREYQVSATGLKVGQPLFDFQGVLSGDSKFVGETTTLLDQKERGSGRS